MQSALDMFMSMRYTNLRFINIIIIIITGQTLQSAVQPVAAAQLWNSLPDDIVLADSLLTFWH